MQHLPIGTVTLLFTDIEGSTQLLEHLGKRYTDVLAECRSLLRTAFHACGGHEVDTQGDAFFVAFARATDAVCAAVEMQHAMARHAWPVGGPWRVRMGLHTGEPQLSAEGYVGLDLHQAACIMSAGHGGQVLLSQTTRDLVAQGLPKGVGLRDLGEYRLKDLQRASHLYQLVIADLQASFPPLKTLDASHSHLPVQPTPLIGREKEVVAVQRLLHRQEVRLLTLTGPGGTGKTRLGLQVAAELGDVFSDGVYFVNLAPLSDPEFVVPTITQTLDLKETGTQLKTFLREKQLLLLLDNFEQVVDAAMDVAALLAVCPHLKVLVTSRMPLHVQGEQEFAVPPLAVPDPKRLPDLVTLSQYEAVALFVARSQAVRPNFQVTNASAPAIAEICVRLDGLPLAIELAAARIKLFSPQALLSQLSQRLQVLTSGARDAPPRQQTLRRGLAWSYDLLTAEEQRLFRRLSVFVGGCMLEGVEAVCAALDGEAAGVVDGVSSLIDKSLLQCTEQESQEPRLVMLETIREYALEALASSGEMEDTRRAHTAYYLGLAEEAEPHLKGAQQVLWWKRLEQEQENLRAAMSWLIGQEEGELALRLSTALWWFWNIRGYWSEGGRWLEAVLGLPQAQGRTVGRAKALLGAGVLAYRAGHRATRSWFEESVAIYRELADKRGLAEALDGLAHSMSRQNDVIAGRRVQEESLALAGEVGDPWLLASILRSWGNCMGFFGDFKSARLSLEESVTLFREIKDKEGLLNTLNYLVSTMMFAGQATQAAAVAEENLALARELDSGPDLITALHEAAVIQLFQGDTQRAVALLEESLALARERGDKNQIAGAQFTLGSLALYRGELVPAEACVQEALALSTEQHHEGRTARALALLGEIRRRQSDLAQARAVCTEGVLLAKESGWGGESMALNLIVLAKVAADEGQSEQAARLFGAAEPWLHPDMMDPLERAGSFTMSYGPTFVRLHPDMMDPLERADYEHAVAGVRAHLGEKVFTTTWAQGRTMTPEQGISREDQATISTATLTESSAPPAAKPPPHYPDGLTTREVEVLRLVARGITNDQAAEQLVISARTVNTHLTSIYGKIGVSSRSAATRYAIEHHLI